MDWESYQKRFLEEAKNNNKSKSYCDKWLSYAEHLYKQGLPVIYNQEHLCRLLGYLPEYVYAASNSPQHFYRRFKIKKKNGKPRDIAEPLPNLKDIQKWILINVLYKIPVSPYAKAYIKNKNIKENVRFHRKQKMVLTLDVHDFFGSITSYRVYRLFSELGYNEPVAMMLAGLCSLDNALPQGAPTSAALSNIIMKEFDGTIAKYTGENKIRYTRYADDMTFSGDFMPVNVIRLVRRELKKYGMRLNDEKTRTRKQGQQQEVTGIVVNQKMQLPKKERKQIRQEMYYINKYGLQSHLKYINEQRDNYLNHMLGKVGYGLFINPNDKELRIYQNILRDMNRRV